MFKFPEKMLSVFKDENLQNQFEREGYIVVPFYSEEEISALVKCYDELHPSNEVGFFPSTFSNDKSYRQRADEEVRRIGQKHINHYCKNIRVILGSFIVKNPGPESGMCVHQDMSLVDESRFTGINIWVPLVDLTVENGALFVLPGSHRLFPTYRSSTIPEFFSPIMENLKDYLQPVLIPAGHAVFFDQSIVHFSPPNYSDSKRIVTNTYFTHQDAEFRTYYWDKKTPNQVEEFEQDRNFMLDFEQFGENIHQRPTIGKSLGWIDYNFPTIDLSFMDKHYSRTNAVELINQAVPKATSIKKASLFSKIKQAIFS
jgi:hypothetical protein